VLRQEAGLPLHDIVARLDRHARKTGELFAFEPEPNRDLVSKANVRMRRRHRLLRISILHRPFIRIDPRSRATPLSGFGPSLDGAKTS